MGHIFISYSHKDKVYVRTLQQALQNEGFETWIDDRIDYGTRWPKVIQDYLDSCDAFIVVVSENSYESEWVQSEVARAKRKKKPFFPLLLEGDPWLSVESYNYVNVADKSLPDEKFFRQLEKFTPRNTSGVTRNVIPTPTAKIPHQGLSAAPTYITTGGIILALLLIVFGVNYLRNIPVDKMPTATLPAMPSETKVISTSTETQIPPTFTLEPPTFTPTPGYGSIFMSDGVTMLYIPAGTFSMGSDKHDGEKPAHPVDLAGYYIDKYEVTNAAYKRCVDAGKCIPPKESKSYTRPAYYSNFEFNEFPVIYVDWNMAKTYCEWRSARLPTEAEWEKAARGTDGRTYPWGENISCNKANYQSSCKGDTTQVGSYLDGVSPYGLYDMAGNVWEWVSDWYDGAYYQSSPSVNPLGPDSGVSRVLRGGSWYNDDFNARSSLRFMDDPALTSNLLGFRCARGTLP